MFDPASVLVIDVGGSHVKLYPGEREEPLKFDSGRELTAAEMVRRTLELSRGCGAERISIGYPGKVLAGRPAAEPVNLGEGWAGFDFEEAFGKPVRVINDASMQALGSYEGGRLLFLGLGTALGSTLITENVIVPMELGEFHTSKGQRFGDVVGKESYEALGEKAWGELVLHLVEMARHAFSPDDVVIGGGMAERLPALPKGVRLGDNTLAHRGGLRLWETVDLKDEAPISRWAIA